jgi:hypothetical protein
MNGDAVRIPASGELRGVDPAVDIGYLRRRESDDLVTVVVSEIDVEIVKVSTRGPHDDHFLHHDAPPLSICGFRFCGTVRSQNGSDDDRHSGDIDQDLSCVDDMIGIAATGSAATAPSGSGCCGRAWQPGNKNGAGQAWRQL